MMKAIKKVISMFKALFIAFAISMSNPAHGANFTSITIIRDGLFDGFTDKPGHYKFKYCNGYTGAEYSLITWACMTKHIF